MFARVFGGVIEENVAAARRAWQRVGGNAGRSLEDSSGPSEPRVELRNNGATAPRRNEALHKRLRRRIVGGLTAALAVVALTYSAASALVNGATGSSTARSDYATVMQAASAEYRRARAQCLALAFERRDGCIAEAHASEAKMRSVAMTAPRKELSQLRQRSNQLLLAANGENSIVLEPACNVVARGSASVCAIQVKGTTLEGPEPIAAVKRMPAAAEATSAATEARPTFVQRLAVAAGRDRDHYFANVALVGR